MCICNAMKCAISVSALHHVKNKKRERERELQLILSLFSNWTYRGKWTLYFNSYSAVYSDEKIQTTFQMTKEKYLLSQFILIFIRIYKERKQNLWVCWEKEFTDHYDGCWWTPRMLTRNGWSTFPTVVLHLARKTKLSPLARWLVQMRRI